MTDLHIEKLSRNHDLERFDCGEFALNQFLTKYALPNQLANAAQTYLAVADEAVVGFYSLVVGEIDHADAPERVSKGLSRHPIPVMVLARMGVDLAWQGQGIGAGLLKDAMRRTMHAADIAGIRAFIVHAKHDSARAFYERFGFVASPSDPLHLFLLLKDLRHASGEAK